MLDMQGSYVLLTELGEDKFIEIGKFGNIFFKKGCYVYVGSALNGLERRINRHLRSNKKMHWHIDYLLKYAKVIDVFYKESRFKEECNIANRFAKLSSIKGFGCSDCKCASHLFYGSLNEIMVIVDGLEMSRYHV